MIILLNWENQINAKNNMLQLHFHPNKLLFTHMMIYDFGIKEFGKHSWPPQEFRLSLKSIILECMTQLSTFYDCSCTKRKRRYWRKRMNKKKNIPFKNSRRCSHYLSHLAIFKNIVFFKPSKKNVDVMKFIYPICEVHNKEWHFQMDSFLTA